MEFSFRSSVAENGRIVVEQMPDKLFRIRLYVEKDGDKNFILFDQQSANGISLVLRLTGFMSCHLTGTPLVFIAHEVGVELAFGSVKITAQADELIVAVGDVEAAKFRAALYYLYHEIEDFDSYDELDELGDYDGIEDYDEPPC